MLASLFAVLAPVFIVAGIGYAWARSGIDYPTEFIARLVMNIGTPALVLSTLSRTKLDQSAFTNMALACVLCMVAMIVLVFLAGAVLSPQHSNVFLLSAFGFSANMAVTFQDVGIDSLAVDIMAESERAKASGALCRRPAATPALPWRTPGAAWACR